MRETPRLSTNDLARYMVAGDNARMSIAKNAKFPKSAPMVRYKDVRSALTSYLTDPSRSVNHIVTAETMFTQRASDPSETSFRQDDARKSIEVLHAAQRMGNELGRFEFHKAPSQQTPLTIGGVEIFVRTDLQVYGVSRGILQIGGAIFRMSQDDAGTDSAKFKRKEMGMYVATLIRLHLEHNGEDNRTLANHLCMSIDVQHGEIFQATGAVTRRIADIESACKMLALLWPTLEKR